MAKKYKKRRKGWIVFGIIMAVLVVAFMATWIGLTIAHDSNMLTEIQSWGDTIKSWFTKGDSVKEEIQTAMPYLNLKLM